MEVFIKTFEMYFTAANGECILEGIFDTYTEMAYYLDLPVKLITAITNEEYDKVPKKYHYISIVNATPESDEVQTQVA